MRLFLGSIHRHVTEKADNFARIILISVTTLASTQNRALMTWALWNLNEDSTRWCDDLIRSKFCLLNRSQESIITSPLFHYHEIRQWIPRFPFTIFLCDIKSSQKDYAPIIFPRQHERNNNSQRKIHFYSIRTRRSSANVSYSGSIKSYCGRGKGLRIIPWFLFRCDISKNRSNRDSTGYRK